MSSTTDTELVWRTATDKYEVALDELTLVCRNAKHKRLKSVPKAARTSPAAEELSALADYLTQHTKECRDTIEAWMLSALPIPTDLLREVWPDPSWRESLANLAVVSELGADPGFLREIDADGQIGVINLDAETEWFTSASLYFPHPALLEDLADVREFAAELGIKQHIPQLAREIHYKPDNVTGTHIDSYANGAFEQLRTARDIANRHGFLLRGGYLICSAVDNGQTIQARYWIGNDSPDYATDTGSLLWVDNNENPIPLAEIGPIAWSEGIRMAELIYAGRKIQNDR